MKQITRHRDAMVTTYKPSKPIIMLVNIALVNCMLLAWLQHVTHHRGVMEVNQYLHLCYLSTGMSYIIRHLAAVETTPAPLVVDEEEDDDDGFFNRKNTVSSGSVQHSLDAEGAFDTIPHVVIFGKLDGIVPDYAWHVMYL